MGKPGEGKNDVMEQVQDVFAVMSDAFAKFFATAEKCKEELAAAGPPPHKPKMYRRRGLVEAEQLTFEPGQLERMGLEGSVTVLGRQQATERVGPEHARDHYAGEWLLTRSGGMREWRSNGEFQNYWEEVPDDGDDTREANYGDRL